MRCDLLVYFLCNPHPKARSIVVILRQRVIISKTVAFNDEESDGAKSAADEFVFEEFFNEEPAGSAVDDLKLEITGLELCRRYYEEYGQLYFYKNLL